MMRLAAAVLVAILVGFPVSVMPGPPVTWLAAVALVVAGAGVALLSVTLVTVGASLALIAYTIALVIVQPAVDPVAAIGVAVTLVILLALVHFADRVHGAALGPGVIATQVRQWMAIVAAGALAAATLTMVAALLGAALATATLPMVVAAAALGALLTVAGVIALTTREDPPRVS